MAHITENCGTCGRAVEVHVGQTWRYGLRWSMSCLCPFCRAAYEADGRGFPPLDIREALLREEGEWELRVPEAGAPRTCIAKVVRRELALPLAKAAALVGAMPGVVATGTRAEMHWLREMIQAECGYLAVAAERA